MLYTRLNQLPHARLGVVVAKRFAPRAATRNTIKRVTRELFRQTGLPAIDCVVRLAKPVNTKDGPATTAKLKTALRLELTRLFAAQAAQERQARSAAAAAAANLAEAPAEAPAAVPAIGNGNSHGADATSGAMPNSSPAAP